MGTRHNFSDDDSMLPFETEAMIFPNYVPPSNGAAPERFPADHVDDRGSEQHGVAFNHMTQVAEREDGAGTAHVKSIDQKTPYKEEPFNPVPVVIVKDHTLVQGSVIGYTLSRIVVGTQPTLLLGPDPFRTKLIIMAQALDSGGIGALITINELPITNTPAFTPLVDFAFNGIPISQYSGAIEINTTGSVYGVPQQGNNTRIGMYIETRQGGGNKIVDHQ